MSQTIALLFKEGQEDLVNKTLKDAEVKLTKAGVQYVVVKED